MKRAIILIVAMLLWQANTAIAELCPQCKDRVYTADIGRCKECGGATTSGAFQLCPACSAKLHQCEHCRAVLPTTAGGVDAAASVARAIDTTKDGTYTAGRWEYRYAIGNAGTRSEGYYGKLLFEGKPLPEPAALNDFYQTPWGAIYWVGDPSVIFGVHGWMPQPRPSERVGKLLAQPRPNAFVEGALAVSVKVIETDCPPAPGATPIEPWIAEELNKLGVEKPVVSRDWSPLGADFLTLSDSKYFGLCGVRAVPAKDDQHLAVNVVGGGEPVIELPRREGATRLVHCTVDGSLASKNLFLAFKVEGRSGAPAGGAATGSTER